VVAKACTAPGYIAEAGTQRYYARVVCLRRVCHRKLRTRTRRGALLQQTDVTLSAVAVMAAMPLRNTVPSSTPEGKERGHTQGKNANDGEGFKRKGKRNGEQ
jgi:hypothetical protein